MNWPKAYLEAIRSGEEAVSAKVRAVYERESAWMDAPPADFPFVFDEARGEHHIDFMERFCKHSKGRFARQPFRLELFQKAKLQLAYGWVERDTGLRRFREVVDLRGRKCGKSTETAAVEWDMLVDDGESGAEIYCTANKKDQARLIFDEATNMRSQSPALSAITKKRQSDIYFPMTFSFIKALAADTKTMDGLNAHFFSLDEFHEARTRKVYDVMKQSQAAREQPMAWLISTNGFVREGFFDDIYAYASGVALWEPGYQDYRLLPLIYELDAREEWTDPRCWPKANPGLGRIKSVKTLTENVERAKRDPAFLPTVLTKDFNIPENSADAWLPFDSIVNRTVAPMEMLEHSYAIGGCDLSATTDLTCATLLIRKPGDPHYYVLQKYFLPKARVERVIAQGAQEAPYKLWAEQGWLQLCEGAAVDYNEVTSWFVDMVMTHDIAGHRRQKASELAGFSNMPCIVREMTDDEAKLAMTDDNLRHREKLLPSEKAAALQQQFEAISHQGVAGEDKEGKASLIQTTKMYDWAEGSSRSQLLFPAKRRLFKSAAVRRGVTRLDVHVCGEERKQARQNCAK